MNLNLKAESYVNLGNLCKVHTVNVWQLDYMIVRNKEHNSFCLVIKKSDDIVNSRERALVYVFLIILV